MNRIATLYDKLIVLATLLSLAACESSKSMLSKSTVCGLAGASIAPSSATMVVGDTLRFRAGPIINSCTVAGPFVPLWTTSDATVATIDSISGLATARNAGKATIIASAPGNPALATAAAITVVR